MEKTDNNILPDSLLESEDNLENLEPPKSVWRETLENMLRTPSAVIGMLMLGFLVVVAFMAPVIAPHEPNKKLIDIPQEGAVKRSEPCIHLLGCPKAGDTLIDISVDETLGTAELTEERLMITRGNTVEVWKVENETLLFELEHDAPVTAAAWRSDQAILVASGDNLFIWKERKIIETLENEGGAEFVQWTSDGTHFVSVQGNALRFWFDCSTVSFAPSCTTAGATWVVDGEAELEEDWISIQWHPDRPELMVARGNTVELWTTLTGQARVFGTYEHDEPVTSALYNKRGTRILTTSGSTLHTWQAGSPFEEIQAYEYTAPLTRGSWSAQTKEGRETIRVTAVSGSNFVIWDAASGEILQELAADAGVDLIGVEVSPLATQYLAYSSNTLYVWDAESGELVFSDEDATPINYATWRFPNGGNIVLHRENSAEIIKTVNFQYIMGIDGSVRDQFSRLVYGTRVSLAVGLLSVTLAIVIGTGAGLISGYVGGWTDNIIMRLMDVMLAFPSLILAIAVVTILGEDVANFFIKNIPFLSFLDPGLVNALIAISVVFVPAYARIARSGVLSVKEYDYISAYKSLGATPGRILFRRILPNVLAPLIVQATLGIGTAILDAAALSFLGLGAQPPIAEWGRMLSEERAQFQTAPYLVLFPGLAIMFTVLAFNLLGDGLRDALDPRLNR